MNMGFENSKQQGSPHHLFTQLSGAWKGVSRLWLEPDSLTDESPVQGSIQLVLDGRFALYLYEGSIESEPQHGIFTFGYNTLLDRFEATWIDSFHNNTAMMFCEGPAKENGFEVLGHYPDPTGGPDWDWRTEVTLEEADHLTITAYNISPEGFEAKAAETRLMRVRS
jgi:hypothetical protein